MKADPCDLEWQRRYDEKDTPWDKGAPAPALARALREGRISGRVLVPGCGRGHEVRALGAQTDMTAVGLDLSATAVAEAKAATVQADVNERIRFVAGDFFRLPADFHDSFDWLVEHTCFCAIDPADRPRYVKSAAAALRPHGQIFGIFYLTPDVESGPPFAVSKEELSALFDPHFLLVEEWTPKETFPGREGRELVRILRKKS